MRPGKPASIWRTCSRWATDAPRRTVMVRIEERLRDELAWDIAGDFGELAHELRTPSSDAERDAALRRIEADALRAGAGAVLSERLAPARASGDETMPIQGHALLFELAPRNLIENALGHTARGTRIEVQIDAAATLQVCDDGAHRTGTAPGTLNLGLGHRAVDKVARTHDGHFGRADPPACFRLRLRQP